MNCLKPKIKDLGIIVLFCFVFSPLVPLNIVKHVFLLLDNSPCSLGLMGQTMTVVKFGSNLHFGKCT